MPWCEPCQKNFTPTTLDADGRCPQCGEPVDGTPGVDHEQHRTPWHFYLGVGAAGAYLVWRAIEGLIALF